jgi:hypothetical protein
MIRHCSERRNRRENHRWRRRTRPRTTRASFGEISTHRSTSASGQSRKERQVGWEEVCRCASCAHRSCWMFGSRTDSAVMPLSLGNPFAFPQVASYGQIARLIGHPRHSRM